MPEYLSPGVYVEEISTRERLIEGVGTSTAGFIGATQRGPEHPVFITNFLDFERWYGGFIPDVSYLAYAAQAFFTNGGQRCFVTRTVPDEANSGFAFFQSGNLVISANGRGAWGNNLVLRIEGSQSPGSIEVLSTITLLFYAETPDLANFLDPFDPTDTIDPNFVEPEVVECFENLTHVEGRTNSITRILNAGSKLIRCWWGPAGAPAHLAPQAFMAAAPNAAPVDGTLIAGDFTGDDEPIPFNGGIVPPDEVLGKTRGLCGLRKVGEVDILVAPDSSRGALANVATAVVDQCEQLKDRFAILATPQATTPDNTVRAAAPWARDTSFAALYFPWLWVFDAPNNRERLIPPHGHVAGIMARTDVEHGVHKAPANEVPRGVVNLERPITKGHQDILNPMGVNCFRDFRAAGRGIRLWGARTMSSDREWKYVNVRRLLIFVEKSIEERTKWVVFEPNHEQTWANLTLSITAFLILLWRNRAVQGVTQDEAFFVKCDRTTMTQNDIDNGRLICDIGIAPVKPAEFVIFRKTFEGVG